MDLPSKAPDHKNNKNEEPKHDKMVSLSVDTGHKNKDETENEDDEIKEDLFFVPKPKEQEQGRHIKLNVVLDDIWARAHLSEKEGGVKRSKKLAFKGLPRFPSFFSSCSKLSYQGLIL
jgi:hypothetical protein